MGISDGLAKKAREMGQSVVVLVLVPLVPVVLFAPLAAYGNEDAKRLYDDLLVNYNKHRRPTPGPNIPVTIKLKLRLSQIIDVVWIDNKLSWDPRSYGGVSVLYVPYEMIWVPDIVLYNKSADSESRYGSNWEYFILKIIDLIQYFFD
ncbi:unnamed protein product [Gongylonema pulchrum]|uniref:Neur_chan_LBD domain-containing protein n=1 Tax=Gongylonema pulchrum TaxID=637853 RepID=A0A183DED5_9BILA|nr:unnamed protein product [Gongylonema pulchrum]